ncbi:MAG: TetR family transcriptional regulator C-terminal domain-containing protein [Hyphomonadaceae bacterium]|nr:TetR family transcriptional regulator C-terminal domain-containing protein [Hyphomonadaceae bacterium]
MLHNKCFECQCLENTHEEPVPREVDHQERRAHFVAASTEVISKGGFDSATMRNVAAEAGCTTGALTHYFPDRLTLLVETLRTANNATAERMRKIADQALDDSEKLRAVIYESLPMDERRLKEWRVWLSFWAACMNEPALAKEQKQKYHEWRSALTELLEPLSDHPREDAEFLVVLIDGLGIRAARLSNSSENFATQEESMKRTIDRFMRSLNS